MKSQLKSLLIFSLLLLFASCSTTMPRNSSHSAIWVGSIIGASAGFPGFFPHPTRTYGGIDPKSLYNHIIKNATTNHFVITSANKSTGITMAEYDKGIIKKILFWEWKQKYIALFDLDVDIEKREIVRLIYSFKVIEKPPLSSDYVEIMQDTDAQRIKKTLLSAIDDFVLMNGGTF